MTMVACGVSDWPRSVMGGGGNSVTGSNTTITLDSTTDCLYWVGQSPITDSLSTLYFRTMTITAAGGDTVDVRIETVANGRRTGTLWAANTNIAIAIDDTDDNLWKTATLTAPASLTEGDEFAIVIASSAGTPNIPLATSHAALFGEHGQYPIQAHNLTGADAVGGTAQLLWIVRFTTAGVKYMIAMSPLDGSIVLTAFNNASATHERALRLKSSVPRRVIGARVFVGNIAAGADFTISLWDATGDTDAEALGQAVIDGDFPLATTSDGYVDVMFDAKTVIAKDTVYYVGLRPDTANSVTLFEMPTAGSGEPADAIKAFPQESSELYLATRTWAAGTASAWTNTTTTYPIISLLYDQLDDGAGAAGGGMRLAGTGGLAA